MCSGFFAREATGVEYSRLVGPWWWVGWVSLTVCGENMGWVTGRLFMYDEYVY
jgi:hypothetical protein